jgi:catechol 2,3-dioxygenase-like lactoylglutathione lyase family enzyme
MGEMRVLVGTKDYAKSTAFYGELLRFPVQDEWDAPDGRGILFATGGGVIEVLEDSPHHPAETPHGVMVSIQVADVDALHARLTDAGVAPTDSLSNRPWGHRSFAIRDPNGLPLTFFQVLEGAVAE